MIPWNQALFACPIRSYAPLFSFCGAFFSLLVSVSWCHVEHCLFVPRKTLKILILFMFQLKRHLSLTQMSLHLHLFISYSLQVVASQFTNLFDNSTAARIG